MAVRALLILTLIASSFLAATSAVRAQLSPSPEITPRMADTDVIQEYKQEVRGSRPSVTYQVFEPAIIFFRKMKSGWKAIIEVLQPQVLLSQICQIQWPLATKILKDVCGR